MFVLIILMIYCIETFATLLNLLGCSKLCNTDPKKPYTGCKIEIHVFLLRWFSQTVFRTKHKSCI
jgi:hypothetical protein